jgi:hypothetical protein
VIGLGLHDKVRATMGDMGIGKKPKIMIVFYVLTAEELIRKV